MPILFAPKFAESNSLGMLADTLGEQWREGAKTPVPSRSVGYTLRSEGVLEMLYADFGSVGEDTDHVEAQGVVLWSSGVEVGFGYGAQGVLFAGGDGLQWISEAGTAPQLDLDEDERLCSLVQNTMTSEVRFRAELSENGVERLELARA